MYVIQCCMYMCMKIVYCNLFSDYKSQTFHQVTFLIAVVAAMAVVVGTLIIIKWRQGMQLNPWITIRTVVDIKYESSHQ